MPPLKLTLKNIGAAVHDGQDVTYWDTEVTGFGLRITRAGVRSFVVQYRNIRGRSRRVTIGRFGVWAPDQAREEAKRLLRLADTGNDPAEMAAEAKRAVTVEELASEYLEAAKAGLILNRNGKPKRKWTILLEEGRLRVHIVPRLGNFAVRDLTRSQIVQFHRQVVTNRTGRNRWGQATGGVYAGKLCVMLLSMMMKYAETVGYREDDSNPCRGVTLPRTRQREFRLDAAGWGQLGERLKAAEGNGMVWQAIAIGQLLALTGCRMGEIVGMTWTEVDLPGHCLRFDGDRVKTGPFRPIGGPALAILEGLKGRAADTGSKSPYVFPGFWSEGHYRGFPDAWGRINTGFSIHCLRHAFASAADDCGLHESTTGALLGHAKPAGNTTRGYVHKADATLIAAADKVSGFIWNAMKGG